MGQQCPSIQKEMRGGSITGKEAGPLQKVQPQVVQGGKVTQEGWSRDDQG